MRRSQRLIRMRRRSVAGLDPVGSVSVDLVQELLKAWGPPGVITIILWVMLRKSESREEKKDVRIQMLENLLTESYDERIEAANQVSSAIHDNSTALAALTNEIRARQHV